MVMMKIKQKQIKACVDTFHAFLTISWPSFSSASHSSSNLEAAMLASLDFILQAVKESICFSKSYPLPNRKQ